MIIDVCAAVDVLDHLILLKNKMEDLSVRVRAMQAFIVKSNMILGSVGIQPPSCPQVKFGKKQLMF